MGSSHSQSKQKDHQQVKPFCSGPKSFGRVLDAKGIEYVQVSLGEVKEKETNSQKEIGIVTWWKHLISRLTRSGNIRAPNGSLTPETQHLDSILTSSTCDSDGDISVPSMISHQHCNANKYLGARRNLNEQVPNNIESYVLVRNYPSNNASHTALVPPNGEPLTNNEFSTSLGHRPHSPALHYVNTNYNPYFTARITNNPEIEEVSIAQAEAMYTKATWRMYERITSFRMASALSNQRFCLPDVQPRSEVDISLPPSEERGPCFQKPLRHDQHEHLEYYDTQITSTGTYLQHPEEGAHDGKISGSGLNVDSHHICFEMDQD